MVYRITISAYSVATVREHKHHSHDCYQRHFVYYFDFTNILSPCCCGCFGHALVFTNSTEFPVIFHAGFGAGLSNFSGGTAVNDYFVKDRVLAEGIHGSALCLGLFLSTEMLQIFAEVYTWRVRGFFSLKQVYYT